MIAFIIMSRTRSSVNSHSIISLNVKEFFARSRSHIWILSDSNVIRTHNHLVRKPNTQPFSQTGQMIELCCEYLSVRCGWLYVIIMSSSRFRVNPHSIICLNAKELPAWRRRHILNFRYGACFEQGFP